MVEIEKLQEKMGEVLGLEIARSKGSRRIRFQRTVG